MASLQAIGNCTAGAIPYPAIFGAEFLAIEVRPVWNYSFAASNINNPFAINAPEVNFCNITVTHTHPGQNDILRTQIWLPFNATWNKRFMMAGGGGWSAGWTISPGVMNAAVADGYATSTVDGGVARESVISASSWALTSPGNVNYNALQDFAYKGLVDGALATKSVIESFYGTGPDYSYWQGCSQGGRQGYMFAERYPEIFDGIAANAPAINWNSVFFSALFPQQVLYELGLDAFPQSCEYDSLTKAAIAACDSIDGLIDGLVADPDQCLDVFDPLTLVGSPATQCDASEGLVISKAAALAMEAAWQGPRTSNGTRLGYGFASDSILTGFFNILSTICSDDGSCKPNRISLFTDWLKYFVKKDPDFNLNNMTRQEYISALHAGEREYASILNTNYPDLSEFRKSGGKLLTYHGMADQLISYRGTRDYYNKASALDANLRDFYRYFEAPGAAHCVAGQGGVPDSFSALVAWVEKGIAPDTLVATNKEEKERLLCMYPKKTIFKGNPSNYTAGDFVCGPDESNVLDRTHWTEQGVSFLGQMRVGVKGYLSNMF
ncbi:Tannase/feruloyl esterase [Paraphoma chrysanthemicola]|nr:Tannase/feruloyl esterase [Paraphoma chrysanthemicola]